MINYQTVELSNRYLYTSRDKSMWIGVNNLQLRALLNIPVDNISYLIKLSTYCPQ